MRGSVVLVGGDPGVGKSTLLLQVAGLLGGHHSTEQPVRVQPGPGNVEANTAAKIHTLADHQKGHLRASSKPLPVLYVSAEESKDQVRDRAMRLGLEDSHQLYILAENRLGKILEEVVKMSPVAVVVDSIQTIFIEHIESSPGNRLQMVECTAALVRLAKKHNICVLVVGHVTKSGDIAGPKNLEHAVDVVLYMEGEQHLQYRILRTTKNRFGKVGDTGVFNMESDGLHAVEDPSRMFVDQDDEGVTSAITVVMSGTRPFLLEIQALVRDRPKWKEPRGGGGSETEEDEEADESDGGGHGGGGRKKNYFRGGPMYQSIAKRVITGMRREKLEAQLAVLEKCTAKGPAPIKTGNLDIYVSTVGGYKISDREVGCELATVAAIVSSYYDIPLPRTWAMVGEVGLTGKLLVAPNLELRLYEAARMGFTHFIVPAANKTKLTAKDLEGMQVLSCKNLQEALCILFPDKMKGLEDHRVHTRISSTWARQKSRGAASVELEANGTGKTQLSNALLLPDADKEHIVVDSFPSAPSPFPGHKVHNGHVAGVSWGATASGRSSDAVNDRVPSRFQEDEDVHSTGKAASGIDGGEEEEEEKEEGKDNDDDDDDDVLPLSQLLRERPPKKEVLPWTQGPHLRK